MIQKPCYYHLQTTPQRETIMSTHNTYSPDSLAQIAGYAERLERLGIPTIKSQHTYIGIARIIARKLGEPLPDDFGEIWRRREWITDALARLEAGARKPEKGKVAGPRWTPPFREYRPPRHPRQDELDALPKRISMSGKSGIPGLTERRWS